MTSQFIAKDANQTVTDLKKALNKYFIPVPVILKKLEGMLVSVVNDLVISGKTLKGSDFNLKTMATEAVKYDKIRYVLFHRNGV